MPEDLEKARPKIEKGDIVMINTGWHHKYSDSTEYFCYSPGLYREAGEWLVAKGVKCVGVDQQALDHPLATAIGPHGSGPLRPDVCAEYKKVTGRDVLQDFPEWEPCHNLLLRNGIMGYENVGGDLDKVTGKRVTFAGFPIRWMKGDGSIVRIVAIVDGK
jgi:kynurenine formamidase